MIKSTALAINLNELKRTQLITCQFSSSLYLTAVNFLATRLELFFGSIIGRSGLWADWKVVYSPRFYTVIASYTTSRLILRLLTIYAF